MRTSHTSLCTSLHFPAMPDYNSTTGDLTYSAANTPLHAYEHALNELLEQLDGIESECDEAVRGRRREVVKEVERALEEFDEPVRAASPDRARQSQSLRSWTAKRSMASRMTLCVARRLSNQRALRDRRTLRFRRFRGGREGCAPGGYGYLGHHSFGSRRSCYRRCYHRGAHRRRRALSSAHLR